MSRSTLLVAVGAVLGGLAVLLTALAAAFEPLLLFLALPFGFAGYLIWYQGSGRLAARVRQQAAREAAARTETEDPRWADPEAATQRARARRRAAQASAGVASDGEGGPEPGPGGRAGPGPGRPGGGRERRPPVQDRMSEREARDVLGVDPGSDAATVRQAYRQRVKDTHPDTEDGDEEAFKRVTEAYDVLGED